MTIKIIEISPDALTVKQLKEALANQADSALVSSIPEIKANDRIGLLMFLVNDLPELVGLIRHVEYFNITRKWADVPQVPLYIANVTADVTVRDDNGAPTGEAIRKGNIVSVYREFIKLGGYENRVTITPDDSTPRKNIWKNNIQEIK